MDHMVLNYFSIGAAQLPDFFFIYTSSLPFALFSQGHVLIRANNGGGTNITAIPSLKQRFKLFAYLGGRALGGGTCRENDRIQKENLYFLLQRVYQFIFHSNNYNDFVMIYLSEMRLHLVKGRNHSWPATVSILYVV